MVYILEFSLCENIRIFIHENEKLLITRLMMAVMKRIIFIITSIIMFSSLHGQDNQGGKVYGKVRMASSGEPFQNVTIALYSLPDSALTLGVATDNNGDFEINSLPNNDYILIPSFVGFESKVIRFSITPEGKELNTGDIILAEKTEDLGGVSVTAVRPQIIYRDNKKILSVREFSDAGATTLAEVLENAPSVTLDSEGNVLLRGSSNYTLLIDGKPVPGVGVNMLRQIPPEMVENIEIMTNPSAKYDPDGVTGIINLVLKKQTASGFNGQLSLMAGLGDKYNGDLQLNYRKERYNIYAGVTGTSYNTEINGDIYRRIEDIGGESEISNYLNQLTKIKTIVANLGIDFMPDERNTLSLSGRFGPQNVEAILENQIERTVTDPDLTGNFNFTNMLGVNGGFYMPGLTWEHKFRKEGHKLQMNAFTGGFRGDLTQSMTEEAADSEWQPTGIITDRKNLINDMSINDIRLKVDYELPIEGKGKIEAGYQYRLMLEDNNHLLENYDFDLGEWIEDPLFTNNLTLSDNIQALYSTWGASLGIFNYQIGLRAEFNDRNIEQHATNDSYNYTRFSLFPSGNISMTIKEKMQLQLSYSRRINRPNRNQLNPFPQYADNQLIVQGNPDLKPEFIDSFEFGFQDQVKIGFLSAEAYYRRVSGLITNTITPGSNGVMNQQFTNANRSHSAGSELMANIQPIAWMRIIASGNIYYYYLDDEMIYEENDNSSMVWTTNFSSIFLPTKTTRISLSAIYNGPSINLQGKQKATYMINMGIRQELFKRKASLALSVRDIFATFKFENELLGEDYSTIVSMKPESRVATLTFTYNFNNYRQRAQDESMDLNFIR